MSSSGFDVLISSAEARLRWLRSYREAAEKVKRLAGEMLGEARVFVFGSAVRGDYTAVSDIDVLVVVNQRPGPEKAAELRARAFLEMPDAPLEIHIATEDELKGWYMKFIKEDELVEV